MAKKCYARSIYTTSGKKIINAGKNISCRAVDVRELINKTPTFEDIEDEEEDDTGGITIQTDIHGEDVDVAAVDDD